MPKSARGQSAYGQSASCQSDSGDAHCESAAPKQSVHAEQFLCSFTEGGSVTLAALLNLLRLMGAELVLTHARGETERFEQAVRAKISQFTSPSATPQAREAGLAYAKDLVEQVMAQIRAQAQLQKTLSSAARHEVPQRADGAGAHLPRLLN